MPEAFRHPGEEYDDEARRLSWLTRAGTSLVWLAVAAVLITCSFRIFTHAYLGNIEHVLPH